MKSTERIWAIATVRDEADIIGYAIRHLASQEIDGVLIADNNSRDATRDVIRDVAAAIGINDMSVVVVADPEVGFHQSRGMTRLANTAHTLYGARWIVPFDADEMWFSRGATLGAALRAIPKSVHAVATRRWNHWTTADDPAEANPFVRMAHRERVPMKSKKVAFRFDPGYVVRNGQHSVKLRGQTVPAIINHSIRMRHFPYRSLEHFIRKSVNGLEAVRVANVPRGMAGQWRKYGELFEAGGEPAMREAFHAMRPADLVKDPAPYCQVPQ